jgi:RimK family alpha-L-glutamate ligase
MRKIWILSSDTPDDVQYIKRDKLVSEGTPGGQYENIRLFDEFKKFNFDVSIMDPSKIKIRDYNSITFNNANIDLPDAVLIRTTNGNSISTLQMLKKIGIRCINNIDAHLICANKPKQLDILYRNSVDIPKTWIMDILFDESDLDKFQFPIVIKPISSQRGEMVKLCKTVDDAYIHCKNIRIKYPNQNKVIFQEPIYGPTIVAWVIGRIPIAAQIRYSKSNVDFFISNNRDDGIREQYKINDKLKNIIVDAINVLNIEIAKIDILKLPNGYVICEVNSPGGFSGRDDYFNANHAKDIAEYIRGLI